MKHSLEAQEDQDPEDRLQEPPEGDHPALAGSGGTGPGRGVARPQVVGMMSELRGMEGQAGLGVRPRPAAGAKESQVWV